MVDSISRGGYFNFRNIDFRLLHSSVKRSVKRSGEDERRCARINIVFKSECLYLLNINIKSKEKVMKAKRQFKGSNYWITEDLTSVNLEKLKYLNELRRDGKIRNVWTTDGKIRVRRLNDSIVTITSFDDIKLLARE